MDEQRLRAFLDSFNRHDLDAIMSFFNVHYGDDRHFIAGERGASGWLLTGTTAAGQPIEVRGCDLFEFREDKIVRKDSYWKIVER